MSVSLPRPVGDMIKDISSGNGLKFGTGKLKELCKLLPEKEEVQYFTQPFPVGKHRSGRCRFDTRVLHRANSSSTTIGWAEVCRQLAAIVDANYHSELTIFSLRDSSNSVLPSYNPYRNAVSY